jgi:hypothetical protein
MATLTKITKTRRRLRRAKAGRDRKQQLEKHGTTPAFPVHTPAADANAPAAQVAGKTEQADG